MKMKFWNLFEAFRPKVTPDPEAAAALEERMRAVNYTPKSAPFHRDQVQRPSTPRKQA
jgi:hypothetical protein